MTEAGTATVNWYLRSYIRRPEGHYRTVFSTIGATAFLGFLMLLASVYVPDWALGLLGMSSERLVRTVSIVGYPALWMQLLSGLGLMTFIFVWLDRTHHRIARIATAMEMAAAPVLGAMLTVAAAYFWDAGWTWDVTVALFPVVAAISLSLVCRSLLAEDIMKGGLIFRGLVALGGLALVGLMQFHISKLPPLTVLPV